MILDLVEFTIGARFETVPLPSCASENRNVSNIKMNRIGNIVRVIIVHMCVVCTCLEFIECKCMISSSRGQKLQIKMRYYCCKRFYYNTLDIC